MNPATINTMNLETTKSCLLHSCTLSITTALPALPHRVYAMCIHMNDFIIGWVFLFKA